MKTVKRRRIRAFLLAMALIIWQPGETLWDIARSFARTNTAQEENAGKLALLLESGQEYEDGTWTAIEPCVRYIPASEEEKHIQYVCLREGVNPEDITGEKADNAGEQVMEWNDMEEDAGGYTAKLSELPNGKYAVYVRSIIEKAKRPPTEETPTEPEEPSIKETPTEPEEPQSPVIRGEKGLWIDRTAPKIIALKLYEDKTGTGGKDGAKLGEQNISARPFHALVKAEDEHSGVSGFWYRRRQDEPLRYGKAEAGGQIRISFTPEEKTAAGELCVYAEDKAGNRSAGRSEQYRYDAAAPVIDMEHMTIHPLDSKGQVIPDIDLTKVSTASRQYWQKYGVEINGIRVKDEAGSEASGLRSIWAERNGERTACQIEPRIEKDKRDVEEKTMRLRITTNAAGSSGDKIRLFAEDQAGNRASSGTVIVKVDQERPGPVRVTYQNPEGSLLAAFPAFRDKLFISNHPIAVHLKSSDRLSGVKAIYYRLEDEKEYQKIAGESGVIFLPPEFSGKITAYAEDVAGNNNECGPSLSDKAISEDSPPAITIASDKDTGQWQSGDIHFTIQAEELRTISGLQSITCRLNGRVVIEKDYTLGAAPVAKDTIRVTASEEAADEKGYLLEVEAYDLAGNYAYRKVRIRIDKTAPTVKLSGVADGGIYRENRAIGLTLHEQNFSRTKAELRLRRKEPGREEEESVISYSMDRRECIHEYLCAAEGVYVLEGVVKDAAGNETRLPRMTFTIDKTSPTVKLSGAQPGDYYNRPVAVNVTVEEAFYENNRVELHCVRELDGKKSVIALKPWSNTGRRTSWQDSLSEDGSYELTAFAVDEAGNRSGEESLHFNIDRTPPKLHIEGVRDYDIVAGPVTLKLGVEESYYDSASVKVSALRQSLNGICTAEPMEPFLPKAKTSEQSYRLYKDGIYDISLLASDKAGNQSRERRRLIIDTKKPIIRFVENLDGRYLREFTLRGQRGIVNDLTVPSYKMYLNGLEYDGYEVIKKEGRYRLQVTARDEAGHEAKAEADFIIDRTPPDIIFEGLDNEEEKTAPREIFVKAGEGEQIEKILVNGKEQIKKPVSRHRLTLKNPGDYSIEAVAVDKAGNRTAEVRSLTIQSLKPLEGSGRPISSILLLAAAAGIFIAAGCVVGLPILFLRKG